MCACLSVSTLMVVKFVVGIDDIFDRFDGQGHRSKVILVYVMSVRGSLRQEY